MDTQGILKGEGWFDVDATKRIDNSILEALQQGRPIEVSTGLYTENIPAPPDSVDHKGRTYSYIARNYRADHLAILPNQKGACSVSDGCGVMVNEEKEEAGQGFDSAKQRKAFFAKLDKGDTRKKDLTQKRAEEIANELYRKILLPHKNESDPKKLAEAQKEYEESLRMKGIRQGKHGYTFLHKVENSLHNLYSQGRAYNWVTLNADRPGRSQPPKKGSNKGDGDDEDFASDNQRRAFFGKLKQGKIGSTKRTKQVGKPHTPTSTTTPTRKIGKHTTPEDVSSIRKGEKVRDEDDREWEVVSTTSAGGRAQVHATSKGESKVFSFGKAEDTPKKPSMLERMKSSGRKDLPNPSVGDIRPLATPGSQATTPKPHTEEEQEFEEYTRNPDRSKFLTLPKDKQSRLKEYIKKDFHSRDTSSKTDLHSVGERIREEYQRKLASAKTEKEINTVRHWYESELHKKRIKATHEGWKVRNEEGNVEWINLNAFCATGQGGGIDPSCSPGKSKGSSLSPGTVVGRNDKHTYSTSFHVGEKEFTFAARSDGTESSEWDVAFWPGTLEHGGSTKMTKDPGTSPIQVLRKVQESLHSFIEEKKPKVLIFTADKTETSRLTFYDRVAKEIEKNYGYVPTIWQDDNRKTGSRYYALAKGEMPAWLKEQRAKQTTNSQPSDRADISPNNLQWLNLNFSPDQPRDNKGRFTRKAIANLPPKKQSLFKRVLQKFGIGKETDTSSSPESAKTPSVEDKVRELKDQSRKEKSLKDSLQRHVDSKVREINHKRAMGERVTKKLEKSLATAERQLKRADKKYNDTVSKLLDAGGSLEGDAPPVSVGKSKHKRYTATSLARNSDVRSGDSPEDHLYNLLCVLEDELGRPLEESEIDDAVQDYLEQEANDESPDDDDDDGFDPQSDEGTPSLNGDHTMNSYNLRWVNLSTNENCGIGKGGFQKGNTCAKGGSNPMGANPQSGSSGGGANLVGQNPQSGNAPSPLTQYRGHNLAQSAYRAIEPALGRLTLGIAPTAIGVASGGKAGGRVDKEAISEMKEVFKAMFSRMTLGVGPLAVKAVSAGIRHSPKAFGLLSKAFMAVMPKKTISDKAQPLGENPQSGAQGSTANPMGQAGAGGSKFSPEKTRKYTRNASNGKPPKPQERGTERAKMYLDQLAQFLKDNPDELEKLIVACKEAMKVMDAKQPSVTPVVANLNWTNLVTTN